MNLIYKNLLLLLMVSLSLFTMAKVDIVFPKNNHTQKEKAINILWNIDSYSDSFYLQIATDSSFYTIDTSINTINTFFSKTFLDDGDYYLRIKGSHDAVWSNVIKFNIFDISIEARLMSWFKADINDVNLLSGNSISNWQDSKNISRNATQGNISQMPLLQNNITLLNNKNVLSFNGNPSSSSNLNINTNINATDYSMFCIRNYKINGNGAGFFLGGNVHGFFSEVAVLNGGFGCGGQNGTGIFSNRTELTTPYAIYNYSSNYLEKNLQPISPLLTFNGNQNAQNISISKIGTRPDFGAFPYEGEIAEIIFFDTIMNDKNKDQVYSYLRNKYAPPVNLGKDTIFGTSFSDSIIIDAQNRFVNYNWSNESNNYFIKVVAGTYSVKVTDVFGFESFDEINIYPYKRLGNKNIYLCDGDSVKINLGVGLPFTFLWDDGTIKNNITVKTNSKRTVKITDFKGQSIYDTINVYIDKTTLNPIPNSLKNIGICKGEKIFINNPVGIDSIIWSNNSRENFYTATSNETITVFVKSNSLCSTIYKDTLNINITGTAPIANFNTSNLCVNSGGNFTDISTVVNPNTITNWQWSNTSGVFSNSQNPSSIFTNTGTQQISLKVTTNAGCSDSIAKIITINSKPKANFGNRLSCSNLPTQFVDSSLANSSSISNWNWSFATLGNSTTQQPLFTFPTTGNYAVKLKVQNSNNCVDSIIKNIFVNVSPIANFTFDSACAGRPTNFNNTSTVQSPNSIVSKSWTFGDGFTDNLNNPSHAYTNAGTYNVKLFVRSTNQCTDSITKTVKSFAYPNVNFGISNNQCVNKNILFTDSTITTDGSIINNWQWQFGGLGTSILKNSTFSFNTQGNYTIQLTATNSVGCSGSKTKQIAITSPPIANYTFTPQYGLPPLNVTFNNTSNTTLGNVYSWDYGDGTFAMNTFNPPAHIYNTLGTYITKLIATDVRGCTDTIKKNILIGQAIIDGIMLNITLVPNGNYYQVTINILNNSNIEINTLDITANIGSGSLIKEIWNGSLLPGQTTNYSFTSQLQYNANYNIPLVCANIEKINNADIDNDKSNNNACKEISIGDFEILTAYPVPFNSYLNLGIMIPKDGVIEAKITDYLGRAFFKTITNGTKGYNLLSLNTLSLNAAMYVVEVSFDGKTLYKKVIRGDK